MEALHLTGDTVVLLMMAILGFFLREKIKRYDKHLEDCTSKSINHAILETQVSALNGKVDSVKELVETKIKNVDQKLDILLNR